MAMDFNAIAFATLRNSLLKPFMQGCAGVWLVPMDLEFPKPIEFAVQLFTQVVLQVEVVNLWVAPKQDVNHECGWAFCGEELLKLSGFCCFA